MAKITLTDPASLSNEASFLATIAANNTLIETAVENTLSRDGTSPNSMSSTLDMNSNRIINLPAPVSNSDAARKIDVVNMATGDVDTATTSADGLMSKEDKLLLDSTFADVTANPYGTTYPSWMYGIGGSSYYDIKPFANGWIFSPNGPVNFANEFPYGSLDQPMGATFSVGAPARPGGVAGFTAPSQTAAYDEFGMSALLTQADSRPIMLKSPGTFTATTFVPTTPITLVSTAGSEVGLEVGMWIRTNDTNPFNGQITGWATNGSGAVTSITVSNWYKRGAGGASGTPSGTIAYINPMDKIWTRLSTTFMNRKTFTGTATSGSATVTGVSDSSFLIPNGTLVYGLDPGLNVVVAHGTVVTGMNAAGTTIFLSANSSYSGTVTFYAHLGTAYNKTVAEEIDVHNYGPNFAPVNIADTGNITNGSYSVTNLVLTSSWRAGLIIYGTGVTPNYVESVDYTNNTLVLKYPATATTVGATLKGINQFDEAGTGFDMLAANNYSNIAYLNRGSWTYGYYSMGALYASFICKPDYLAGLPQYGFVVDGRLNGMPSTAAFAVMDGGNTYWSVNGVGTMRSRGDLIIKPSAAIDPSINGELTFQATSNTELTIKYKGSDGTIRSVALTLA